MRVAARRTSRSATVRMSAPSSHPSPSRADTDGEAFLCACKRTGNAPFCDGTHAQFGDDLVGTDGHRGTASETPVAVEESNGAPVARATPEEPTVAFIHELARDGLSKVGHHGPMTSMGVPRKDLPHWDDLQIMAAQMATKPLLDDVEVATELIIGPEADKPLRLDIPLFVSDMSFGALSEEAKVSLAKGAELAGTGICSGEGGMLPEEQQANSRYFYELASAQFGYREELLTSVQAFHFKGGQGAKTGTGGHLPGSKNIGKISEVRGIPEGEAAISPSTFVDLHTVDDFRRSGDRVREVTGGIPIGMKLSANHIEADMGFALDAGVDYIILDGRGGGTGAAPGDVPQPHQRAHDPRPCPCATISRRGWRLGSRHLDHHRRPQSPDRFREGACTRRGRRCLVELGDAGRWLCRSPDVQLQQLPGWHRHAEARAASPPGCR